MQIMGRCLALSSISLCLLASSAQAQDSLQPDRTHAAGVPHKRESSPVPQVNHGHYYNPNMVQFNNSLTMFPSSRFLPFGPKRYLYAYQTSGLKLPAHMKIFEGRANSDCFIMTFKKEMVGKPTYNTRDASTFYHYGPGTSWTTGRNEMLRIIKLREHLQGWKYEYITLMDDDIMFRNTKKPLDKFEQFLEEYQPAVGAVSIPERDGKKVLKKGTVWPVCAFDALFNAFHHEAVDVLLPYDARYEKMSWYCSQQDIIIRTSAMYKNHVLELRTVQIHNDEHSSYPKGSRLARFRAAKEQQERFEKLMKEPVTRCSRWPCEAERLNGMVVKKHFDYGVPDDNPQAISEKICTSRGPPITPEEKKYAGFGFDLHGPDSGRFANIKPIHPL
uniref:Glycosyltransferase family 92 protein n=1 Tax=Pyramimonas obovata TaxID=1411642 RepID=A0A7S0R053_9CHLO|mmetsp:Transcript_2343/g.4749  ORF Transcript_2343/g.4749 Transcript_2343/m.4749 type:complete len:388 (-) Transcript_2343:2217-3380(-)